MKNANLGLKKQLIDVRTRLDQIMMESNLIGVDSAVVCVGNESRSAFMGAQRWFLEYSSALVPTGGVFLSS